MTTFADCDREAGDILAARLAEVDFHDRMSKRAATWQMDLAVLERQARTIVAMALFNAAPAPEPAQAALVLLRERTAAELFAPLPASLLDADPVVRNLRTISIGLTARSSILWERLAETARNILDPDAQYG